MTSQAPFAARHTVEVGAKESAGHEGAFPEHFSAMSQEPFAALQVVVLGRKPSLGHAGLEPLHTSA